MRSFIRKFIQDENGDLVSQSLIWVLIAIASISMLTLVGEEIASTLGSIAGAL
ncbi:MAG: hypothetical protein U9Q82_07230 [Chloroflexota bacterium]|nr:hypothetical protein [Chloroflexota bacterium]